MKRPSIWRRARAGRRTPTTSRPGKARATSTSAIAWSSASSPSCRSAPANRTSKSGVGGAIPAAGRPAASCTTRSGRPFTVTQGSLEGARGCRTPIGDPEGQRDGGQLVQRDGVPARTGRGLRRRGPQHRAWPWVRDVRHEPAAALQLSERSRRHCGGTCSTCSIGRTSAIRTRTSRRANVSARSRRSRGIRG